MLDALAMKLIAVYFSLDLHVLRFVVEVAEPEDETFGHDACGYDPLTLELDGQASHGPHLHGEVKSVLALAGLDAEVV